MSLGSVTLGRLYEYRNRRLLDRVVRALSIELDLDYPAALAELESLAARAADLAGHGDATALNLRTVLTTPGSAVTLDRFEDDVAAIGADTTESARAVLLDKSLPEPVPGERDESGGKVLLDDDADRGRLLADPVAVERQFQRARQLSDEYSRAGGREAFEADLRQYVEAGLDLVASLEGEKRDAAIMVREAEAERRQLAREDAERKRRALDRADG